MLCGLDQLMERKEDGGVYFIWVPLIGDVRTLIMDETHASRYLVHLGADKTYYEHRDMYGGHVIVDRLTKSASFLAIREDYKMEKLVRLYIDEIVAEHGVPVSVISDRNGRFTSRVFENNTKSLRTRLDMSTTYHPYMDGQSERTIQIFEDMLRANVGRPFCGMKLEIAEEIKVDKTLRFVEEPVKIIDHEVKSLKHSRIPIVKVYWNSN
nr:reverse transcriptase domain-containing protein [Tanacetum cinerariifolium]